MEDKSVKHLNKFLKILISTKIFIIIKNKDSLSITIYVLICKLEIDKLLYNATEKFYSIKETATRKGRNPHI